MHAKFRCVLCVATKCVSCRAIKRAKTGSKQHGETDLLRKRSHPRETPVKMPCYKALFGCYKDEFECYRGHFLCYSQFLLVTQGKGTHVDNGGRQADHSLTHNRPDTEKYTANLRSALNKFFFCCLRKYTNHDVIILKKWDKREETEIRQRRKQNRLFRLRQPLPIPTRF